MSSIMTWKVLARACLADWKSGGAFWDHVGHSRILFAIVSIDVAYIFSSRSFKNWQMSWIRLKVNYVEFLCRLCPATWPWMSRHGRWRCRPSIVISIACHSDAAASPYLVVHGYRRRSWAFHCHGQWRSRSIYAIQQLFISLQLSKPLPYAANSHLQSSV